MSAMSVSGHGDGWLRKWQLQKFLFSGSLSIVQPTSVSCPHSGAGWGLSQVPRLWLLTIRVAFSWHAQQKLLGSEAAFYFCVPEVVYSENYPGMLIGRCTHCPGQDCRETGDSNLQNYQSSTIHGL